MRPGPPAAHRIVLSLELFAGLLAVIVAARSDWPNATLAFLVLLVLAVVAGTVGVFRARTPAGEPRFPRLRLSAIASCVVILVGTVTVGLVPGLREHFASVVMRPERHSGQVIIERVDVAYSDTAYEVSVFMHNLHDEEVLLHELTFETSVFAHINGCGIGDEVGFYLVDDSLEIESFTADTVRMAGTVAEADAAGRPRAFVKPFEASGKHGCASPYLRLRLPIAAPLPPHRYWQARITVPREFATVRADESKFSFEKLPTEAEIRNTIRLALSALDGMPKRDGYGATAWYAMTAEYGPSKRTAHYKMSFTSP